MMYENLMLQYVRNTLQLNLGPAVNSNGIRGRAGFCWYKFFMLVCWNGLGAWTPSIADFDNDGNRDIVVTNGYPRDVTDHDFVAFRARSSSIAKQKQLIAEIPQIKISIYAFRNTGNLKFETLQKNGEWMNLLSQRAVYVDLDNDGDLDYVINNINEEATFYEIQSIALENSCKLSGSSILMEIIKTWMASGRGQKSLWQQSSAGIWNSPYRGYLSTVDNKAVFRLGKTTNIDSVIIRWPNHTNR